MRVRPAGPKIFIRPEKLEEVDPIFKRAKAAGIEIEHSSEVKRERFAVVKAVVMAIGSVAWHDYPGKEPWCKVGDVIYFAKHAGFIPTDFPDYRLIYDDDVLGVVEEGDFENV